MIIQFKNLFWFLDSRKSVKLVCDQNRMNENLFLAIHQLLLTIFKLSLDIYLIAWNIREIGFKIMFVYAFSSYSVKIIYYWNKNCRFNADSI